MCLYSLHSGFFVNLSWYFHSSINATFSHGLGRLVNDLPATKVNCNTKKMVVSGKLCLCIFATKDIASNTEL